jgi:hypothetical protein
VAVHGSLGISAGLFANKIVLVASVCKLDVIAQNKKPVMRLRAWRTLQLWFLREVQVAMAETLDCFYSSFNKTSYLTQQWFFICVLAVS